MRKRVFFSILVAGLTFVVFYAYKVKVSSYSVDETQPYPAKWAAQGSSNYTITLVTEGLPLPAEQYVLSFRQNEFAQQLHDSNCPDYIGSVCNVPINSPNNYSIPALFQQAS